MDIKPEFTVTLAVILSAVLFTAGCMPSCNDPLQGNIKVFSTGAKGEEETTADQNQVTAPIKTPPVKQEITKRYITITESNSIFSIGIPKGYREERRVEAEKPIDFWFEYVNPEVELMVDGTPVEIPVRWTTEKLGFKSSVRSFSYTIYNSTSDFTSYNLHMVPTKTGEAVPAVTHEKYVVP
ncbi:MAG: hypothetical protein JXA01_04240 [Dehalococcoidia bacterium]|nr:hypothetical protein [Dehalococcoidia bacterium]